VIQQEKLQPNVIYLSYRITFYLKVDIKRFQRVKTLTFGHYNIGVCLFFPVSTT